MFTADELHKILDGCPQPAEKVAIRSPSAFLSEPFHDESMDATIDAAKFIDTLKPEELRRRLADLDSQARAPDVAARLRSSKRRVQALIASRRLRAINTGLGERRPRWIVAAGLNNLEERAVCESFTVEQAAITIDHPRFWSLTLPTILELAAVEDAKRSRQSVTTAPSAKRTSRIIGGRLLV